MMVAIQDKRRLRRKHLGRLRRHLGAPELHLWEKEEEEEDKGSKHGMSVLKQLSLGTTLSTSSLTDCGFPPVCSDGDTADTSEAVSPEAHSLDRYDMLIFKGIVCQLLWLILWCVLLLQRQKIQKGEKTFKEERC